jgi:hypothetical protein
MTTRQRLIVLAALFGAFACGYLVKEAQQPVAHINRIAG